MTTPHWTRRLLAALAVGAFVATPGHALAQDAPSFGADDRSPLEVPGELAVDLRDDVSAADVAGLSSQFGVVLRPNSVWSDAHDKLDVADVDPRIEDALVEAMARDERVEHVERMGLYRATWVPNDPLYDSRQWHLKRVGAEVAWHYTSGRGVTVAIVDTGVACFDAGPFSRGTDLAGTRCKGGWNFVDDSERAADDQGHGTHVAGTIAQTTHNGVGTAGLAYGATLMPIKVLNRQGFGTVANVAEGVRYAATEGAHIINLSLGGPIRSGILEDAIRYALAKGVVVVAAAGNSGRGVGYPAAYPGVIAVSATDADDKIAWFSSRGPEVSVAAPGVGVTQQTICNGGHDQCEVFSTFNGTSMAAPHVAAAAAMVMALGVTRADRVKDVLAKSSRAQGDRELYGAGIVDAGAAVQRVYWGRLAERAFSLALLGWVVRRRIRTCGGSLSATPGAWVGALSAVTGLFPLAPLFGLATHAGPLGLMARLAMHPVGEWDLVLGGPDAHRWMLLASALPAVALSALFFRSRFVRPFIGGVALGTAALVAQVAWSGDVAFVGGPFLAWLWCLANAGACLWIGRVALTTSVPSKGGRTSEKR